MRIRVQLATLAPTFSASPVQQSLLSLPYRDFTVPELLILL